VIATTTAFAPAERALQEDVQRQHDVLAALPFVHEFLAAVPTMTVILNGQRQIVFANRAFANFIGLAQGSGNQGSGNQGSGTQGSGVGQRVTGLPDGVLGRRPGEAVGCIRSNLTESGCGTTQFCRDCGAVHAILNSQWTHALDIQECRMITGVEGVNEIALDLRVWAHPIDVHGEVFTVFSVIDISGEKRREALERIFFHDVLNTASGVQVCVTVHNAAVMPMAVQRQLFMRSFSTKGAGRGLGTYSIRLISEKYLRGRVSFTSNADEGTTFTVRYPKAI